jgi:NADH:ubiquinone oxidoreductase subunit 3 (subunit A)
MNSENLTCENTGTSTRTSQKRYIEMWLHFVVFDKEILVYFNSNA